TLIDALLLLSIFPSPTICLAKGRLKKNPVFRLLIDQLKFIGTSDQDHLVNTCVARINSGNRVLLFPEGTRSPAGELGEFNRGAASISVRAGVPILPVIIFCSRPFLAKGQGWYSVAAAPIDIVVKLCYPIYPVGADITGERGI